MSETAPCAGRFRRCVKFQSARATTETAPEPRATCKTPINIAADVDQHLPERLKPWLDFYLHARNALQVMLAPAH